MMQYMVNSDDKNIGRMTGLEPLTFRKTIHGVYSLADSWFALTNPWTSKSAVLVIRTKMWRVFIVWLISG